MTSDQPVPDNPTYQFASIGLIEYERCPLKDANDCDSGSWMARSDGYLWFVWCGGWECPFAHRSRSDA